MASRSGDRRRPAPRRARDPPSAERSVRPPRRSAVRSPTFGRGARDDDLPLARPPDRVVDAGAVAGHPRRCSSLYPLVRAIWLGPRAATPRATTAVQRVGPVRRRRPQQRVPARAVGDGQVRPAHGADRVALGVGLAVLADKYLRGIGVFRVDLLLDGRHVGRGRQPDVVVPAAAGRRRARQHRLDRRTCSRSSSRRGCCATRGRRSPRSPRRASGRASGSRSCS